MNTVTVSLTPGGPKVLDFKSRADDFLSIVRTVVERLKEMGHDVTVADMGHRYFVSVY